MIRRALISVHDKTGVVEFARALHEEFQVELISTGGTAAVLRAAGLPVTLVEELTGFPELLGGRVKTLHPAIHAAILADRDNPEHMRQLEAAGIKPIDLVVVNLYPFEQTVADPSCTFEQAIEMIDIGGVALLRAAAKNHRHVLAIRDEFAMQSLLLALRRGIARTLSTIRGDAARSAFEITAAYDGTISEWMWSLVPGIRPPSKYLSLDHARALRYGENPHQSADGMLVSRASLQRNLIACDRRSAMALHNAVPISYNNYLDAHAALQLCSELTRARHAFCGLIARRTPDPLIAGPTPAGLALARPTPADPKARLAPRRVWHRLSAGGVSHGLLARGTDPPGPPPATPPQKHREFPLLRDESLTRRNLPHLQRPGASYFVTFRLGSGQLAPEERDIVMECCLFPNGRTAAVHAAVVMPDHVHLLMTPLETDPGRWVQLGEIMKGLRGVSARRINQMRGTSGSLWLDEFFDHILRNEAEMWETLEYMHENPTTAGLDRDDPYPWCAFENDLGWDRDTRGVGVSSRPAWFAGQADAKRAAPERPWFRLIEQLALGLIARATPHRLIAGATPPGAAPAGATLADPALAGATTPKEPRGDGGTHPTACVFIKHTNACGAAVDADAEEAYRKAYLADPNAAMGGVLAVDCAVDAGFAACVMETYERFGKPLKEAGARHAPGGFFVEVWIAPRFTDDAVAIIRGTYDPAAAKPETGEPRIDAPPKKPWGERVRLLSVGDMSAAPDPDELDYRSIAGGMLVQTPDLIGLNEDQWKVVTKRAPTDAEWADLRLAWLIAKHTKSNAISIVKDGMLIGNGAGQMSRVMSCRIAVWLAQENGHAGSLPGSAAASDAFFPFADGPALLLDAGAAALIQPGGSKRDQETIDACDAHNAAMVFTGTRHFRH